MFTVLPFSSSPTRFGAASASQTYAVRVRWLVGSLLSLISLLCTALVLIYNHAYPDSPPAPAPVESPAFGLVPRTTRIVVASRRIEAGAELNESFFAFEDVASNAVPHDAILDSELTTLRGRFAREIINAGHPINRALLADNPPAEDFIIPAGFRATSIPIDENNSVGYQVRPNHRVDVILSFTYKGQPAVIPVVETAKVLSVGMNADPRVNAAGARTATLLVTSDDAMKIELAKQYGKLGLLRASDVEVPATETNANPILLGNIFKSEEAAPEDPPSDNRLVMTDPRTGRQLIYVLKGGRWKMEP